MHTTLRAPPAMEKEEGLDMTLQKKLNDKNVAHPNLFVSAILPASLAAYDFIFLDSINRLGLQPEDLNRLRVQNPSKSFIFIFQSTKNATFEELTLSSMMWM